MATDIPLVIYLDFDGTIIGDITPQVTEWEIISRFCPKELKSFKESLKPDMLAIMRTNLPKMINTIKSAHPNVEFFIYTASDGVWANTVIPCVEAAAGIEINRPILSRKNCLQATYEKSLRLIAPIVYRRLRSRYTGLRNAEQVYQNSILIDNTDILIDVEQHRCIQCPTYGGIYWNDILRHVPLEVLKQNYMEISIMLRSIGVFPRLSSKEHFTFEEFRMYYYQILSEKIKQALKNRKQNKSDNLWPTLTKILLNARLEKGMSDSLAKYIKKKLASAMHLGQKSE